MTDRTSFYPELERDIAPHRGKLGVLLPGLGAVSTTLIAGVRLIEKGLARPIGSLTQMQRMRLGKRTDPRWVPIRDLVPLAPLSDIEFGAWDIFP
ncbi:MAG TPA: inositol-3-phosphate synthase, partial [Thermoanaerobaculia bacterium]